jgi:hypothetical protein
MVEERGLPTDVVVTAGAVPGKTSSYVVHGFRRGELLGVATEAVGSQLNEAATGVAGRAIEMRVRAFQGEVCRLGVIEPHHPPVVHAVALTARERHVGRFVVEGARLLVVL